MCGSNSRLSFFVGPQDKTSGIAHAQSSISLEFETGDCRKELDRRRIVIRNQRRNLNHSVTFMTINFET
jgi:hypothetical protein